MNVGERLRKERERLGMTQTALAEIGGVGKTTQINYEKNNRNPDTGYLLALDAVGVDTYYVLTGRRTGGADSESLEMVGFENALPVPMYDIEAAAGAGRLFDAETIQSTFYLPVELFEAEGVDPAQVVGVTARGDSMGDTIRDREQVLVNRAQRTPDGVFLLRMDGELRLKRVQRVAGGAWVLISDNPAYERELIKPEDLGGVEIIGQAWRKVGRVF
ncbi:S24 family peptidase [Salinicola sp. CR57]|uniref:XRE family transcriptional regulator n=1 Tax=Salinicola sp. CR57 TaxID=1949086 RepID=UPI0018E555A1|nr:S24 family peptidase [Salinicola sp. CR57]